MSEYKLLFSTSWTSRSILRAHTHASWFYGIFPTINVNGSPWTKATKRSVSETKKKFVAAKQNWHCGDCKKQLPAWFEVDHTIRLEHGGSNHVDNLVALCRDCHGKKNAIENL